MAEESDLEKSEAPTAHRLEKAREEGQIPRSRELTSMLMLGGGLTLLWMSGESMSRQLGVMIAQGLNFDHNVIGNDRQMLQQMASLLGRAVMALIPVIGGLILIALAAPLLLGGLMFSAKSFEFKASRMDPIAGFKRLFSGQVLAELLKAILKASLVGSLAAFTVSVACSQGLPARAARVLSLRGRMWASLRAITGYQTA